MSRKKYRHADESIFNEFWRELDSLEPYKKKIEELSYMGEGGLAPANPKQRGYIYGLLKKLNARNYDYGVQDVRQLTVAEASEFIEELKDEVDEMESSRSYNSGGFGLF